VSDRDSRRAASREAGNAAAVEGGRVAVVPARRGWGREAEWEEHRRQPLHGDTAVGGWGNINGGNQHDGSSNHTGRAAGTGVEMCRSNFDSDFV
jgi:hypothetical protein